MTIANLLALLGGIALFLFGMSLMGDSLKKVAGNKLEYFLYHLSNTPIKGILLGTGVTAVIQSSSATSVLVVGFVNSGMMKLKQAIGIVMGAIIGTSITGWIICLSTLGGDDSSTLWTILSTDTLTALIAVAGIILRMFCKKAQKKHLGNIMLGFAVLMFGIQAMSNAVYPLRESETFIGMLTTFSNPFLGIIIGLVFTSVLQSASAAVGILQALAITGAIQFQTALPIIMGIAIGAAVPVLMSALGANTAAKRTALSYLMIDTIGAVVTALLFYGINAFVHFPFMTLPMTAVSIALVNTLFRIWIVLFQAPCIGLVKRIVCLLVKENPEDEQDLRDMDRLEDRFLDHPAVAIEQSRMVLDSMIEKVRKNLVNALDLFSDYNDKKFQKIERREEIIDRYEDKLGTYMMRITSRELTPAQNTEAGLFLHAITDLERIADHAFNVAESAKEIKEKGLSFSDQAKNDLAVMRRAIEDIIELTTTAFQKNDKALSYRVEPLEEVIDDLCDEIKLRHIKRLQNGVCDLERGFPFNDLVTDSERISDHCSNIAAAIIELNQESFETHVLRDELQSKQTHNFAEHYNEYRKQYILE